MGGVGASAAPMNGYPKVFNIESDPREEHNIGEMYNWVIGPLLKARRDLQGKSRQAPELAGGEHDQILKSGRTILDDQWQRPAIENGKLKESGDGHEI